MSDKELLHGEVASPAGRAPSEAWQSVGGEMKRPRDVWIEGDPLILWRDATTWQRRIMERTKMPESEELGLRLRFGVLDTDISGKNVSLSQLTQCAMGGLPRRFEGLFLHAELMQSPEPGLYLAWDNRPPALLTQVWMANKHSTDGSFKSGLEGPFHMNVLLHETRIGFHEAWNDGTLHWLFERMSKLVPQFSPSLVHELSMARSDTRDRGISVGLERLHQELGAEGGFAATSPANRSLST